jgi:hypothetical protein
MPECAGMSLEGGRLQRSDAYLNYVENRNDAPSVQCSGRTEAHD